MATKRKADCTPEEYARIRARSRELKNTPEQKAKAAARHAHRYATEPEYRARKDRQALDAKMKKAYGITQAGKDEMLAAQGGKCAICESTHHNGRYAWHIDHCHTTGKVRAILCTPCNVFLGKVERRPHLLQKTLDYIEHHRGIHGKHNVRRATDRS